MGVDDAVGTIVAALRDTGRLSNTLILFASDNGLENGEHRWADKTVPWESSIRIPVILRYDPVTTPMAGTQDSHLVLNLDFAPTMAAAAGVSAPGAEGASLLSLLQGGTWRTDFLLEHLLTKIHPIPSYCGVRTPRYVYVEYQDGSEELYDLQADPFELDNLAGNPVDTVMKVALHQRMVQLCSPPPPGFQP